MVPVTVVALISAGGVLASGAQSDRADVSLEDADGSWAATAAVKASRQDLLTSRGDSRVLLGADRLEQIERQAEAKVDELRQREAEKRARARAAAERREAAREAREWGAPVQGYEITATFGASSYLWSSGIHTGVDLNAATGTPVTAVGPGEVTFAGWAGSYGYKIVVEHADGMETWYCHLSAIDVAVGQVVTHDTRIGLVGATGNVTGDHLHLELRPAGGGDPLDPVAGLLAHGVRL